jgi:hypothetical protein
MGFFKNVFTAVTSGNLKRGLDASRDFPTPAEFYAGMGEAQVAHAQAAQEVDDGTRVLLGPAGRRLYGDEVRDAALSTAAWGAGGQDALKDSIRAALDVDDPQIEDPRERADVAAAERATRDAAREPYLPANALPVAFTRLPTRGATQVEEVLAWMRANGLAARPDHVFGVYRVPDRIGASSTSFSEQGLLVEWDVVYRPLSSPPGPGGQSAPVATTSFAAEDRWVERRVGEPSLLDEDLGLEFCLRAGIGPERCLGIARVSEFRTLRFGGDDNDYMRTIVKGVVALHLEEHSGADQRMRDEAPLPLSSGPDAAAGVHVEVLDWEAIAGVVHPEMHEPPSVPSPFPYLPSTPDELLRAYLEVVGVDPSDCYSAQATVDRMRHLVPGGFLTSEAGRRQPCADGKERTRLHACEYVIVVYRDAPAYAAGRERWEAYQRDVLAAHLERGVRLRRPVVDDDDLSYVPGPLRGAVRVVETLSNLELVGQEEPPPFRYCWPPAR